MNDTYSILSRFKRHCSAPALCVAAAFLFVTSAAHANVNGNYKYQSAKGSFSVVGQTIKIGKQDLKGIVAKKNGYAVIKNNELLLSPDGGTKLVDEAYSGPNIDVKVTATGPKSITLKKKGSAYVGKTSSPIVVRVEGTASGQPVDATFEYQFIAKVKGDKLILTIPVGGSSYGFAVTGKIQVLCVR